MSRSFASLKQPVSAWKGRLLSAAKLQRLQRCKNGKLISIRRLIESMPLPSCVQSTLDGAVMLEVEVQPGSKRQGILGINHWRSRLSVAVRAEAQKGKANNAVLHVLSTALKIPKQNLRIVSGATSRSKKVRIEKLSHNELNFLLEPYLEEE